MPLQYYDIFELDKADEITEVINIWPGWILAEPHKPNCMYERQT